MIAGTTVTIRGTLKNSEGVLEDASGALTLLIVDPKGGETKVEKIEAGHIVHDSTGKYHYDYLTTIPGLYHFRWLDAGQAADEGTFEMESEFDQGLEPDLTDLRILVPRARRACEGPYGAPAGKPPLLDSQLYAMVADAAGEVILFTGTLFQHELEVKERDPLVGFPTAWKTNAVLNEWEGAVLVNQTALDYFYHLFREMRTSETIKNEGTEYTWSISANVLKAYLETLMTNREKALQGIRMHHPVFDLYASNIRIRDQATVGILEWWDTNSPGLSGSIGVPSGQEAGVIPWTPGWTGPGFGP